MDGKKSSSKTPGQPFSRGMLGSLDESLARKVVSAGGDVAMIIDRDGVICDIALSNEDMAREGAASWLDQPWVDTVTVESRPKVEELLRDAFRGGGVRWREVNQITPDRNTLMIRYVTLDAGHDGRVIAIGRDGRDTMNMQQRLVEAQQAMERDYSRLRDVEFRYRQLFHVSGEAVVVVDAATRKIIEANPAAERLIGSGSPLVGEPFIKVFDEDSREGAASLLAVVQSTARSTSSQMRLSGGRRPLLVSASLFRQDRTSYCLVRFTPGDDGGEVGEIPSDIEPRLRAVMERVPDPFLVTDQDMKILTANSAFLDMVRIASHEQIEGQLLSRFLGRAGLNRNILLDSLKTHGSVRNFSTVLRNQFEEQEDVEVSAVAVSDDAQTSFGFTIRGVGRRLANRAPHSPELGRSVEQLTELVGRVTLKDLVRDATDLVERLCIEAALELTKNNRASAAEVLGLSRQSLYSKLHRFGLGNFTSDDD